jgi:hypothetical protein
MYIKELEDLVPLLWFFIAFFCFFGYSLTRENGRNALKNEKDVQRTLAIQALYANGMGKISEEEFDTHDRIAQRLNEHSIDEISKEELGVYYFVEQKIDELLNLGERTLDERTTLLAINLGHLMSE